jgi:hypothetical protein
MLESIKIDQLCKADYVPKASNMMKGTGLASETLMVTYKKPKVSSKYLTCRSGKVVNPKYIL